MFDDYLDRPKKCAGCKEDYLQGDLNVVHYADYCNECYDKLQTRLELAMNDALDSAASLNDTCLCQTGLALVLVPSHSDVCVLNKSIQAIEQQLIDMTLIGERI